MRIFSNDGGPSRENRLATTDADGRYEFANLAAGAYMISATKGSYLQLSYGQQRPEDPFKPLQIVAGQTLDRVDFTLPRGAVLTGRVVDEFGEPMSHIQVTMSRAQTFNGQRRLMSAGRVVTTDDLGEFRLFGIPPGQYYLQASWRTQNPVPVPGVRADDHVGYASTFFPGVTDAGKAQRFTIAAGDMLSDLVFAMLPIKTTSISGSVTDSQGRPLQGVLMVMHDSGAGYASTGAPIRPDGSFTVAGLPPGDYTLRAQPGGQVGPDGDIAVMKVVATGEDIADLRLVTTGPSTITGRIVVDAASSAPAPRVMLMATPIEPDMMFGGGGPGRMTDDGAFELRARPGRHRIVLSSGGSGWQIRSVRVAGTDVTDSGIDVKPNRNIDRVEVELTNRLTTVAGVVTNARGEPAKNCSAMVFSQDKDRWSNSRYRSGGRTDQDGRYKLSGLPPGSYYIVALERVDGSEAQDPDFPERVMRNATAFSLVEGETRVVDLRTTTVP